MRTALRILAQQGGKDGQPQISLAPPRKILRTQRSPRALSFPLARRACSFMPKPLASPWPPTPPIVTKLLEQFERNRSAATRA